MRKISTTMIAAGALLTAVYAVPARADTFEEWDTDGRAGITSEEFGAGLGELGTYEEWDKDHDGSLSMNEFNDGLYDYYDGNDDGLLDEDEWGVAEDDLGEGGLFDV